MIVRRPRLVAAFALAAAWGLFFAPHLFGDGVPYYRDALITFLPIKAYLGERLRAGQLPQWYPYEALGAPFIGQVLTATFHPQSLLSLWFAPAMALKVNTLAAYLFAAAGAYRFARSCGASREGAVGGGLALAFCGYALGMSNNLPHLVGLATFPWVGFAAARLAARGGLRDAALLALVWALLFLCGCPEDFALAPLLIAASLLGDRSITTLRKLGLFALAGALAALLIGAELLPALLLSRIAVRGVGAPLPTLGTAWALSAWRLPELISAGWVPDEQRFRIARDLLGGGSALWSSSIFAGALVLFFAGAGLATRRARPLALGALAALGVLLALGTSLPFLRALWLVAPVFAKFRYPEKYLALFFVCLPPLVGLGIDRARAMPARHARIAAVAAALLALAGFAMSRSDPAGWLWASRGHALAAGDSLRGALREAWSLGFFTSAGALGVCAALLQLAVTRPRAALALPALIFAEMWAGNGNQLPLVPRALVEAAGPFTAAIAGSAEGAAPPHRVLPAPPPSVPSTVTLGDGPVWVREIRLRLRPDVAGLERISAFGNHLPAISVRQAQANGLSWREEARRAALFDVCFRIAGTPPALVRQQCRSRARLGGTLAAANASEAIALLDRGLPDGTDVWEGGPELPPAAGSVRWLTYRPELLRLEVDADARAALIIADELQPGWTATVDGAPTQLYYTDVAARGLEVPAGKHAVELRFATPGLTAGLWLSLLGVLGCCACAFAFKRRP